VKTTRGDRKSWRSIYANTTHYPEMMLLNVCDDLDTLAAQLEIAVAALEHYRHTPGENQKGVTRFSEAAEALARIEAVLK
jgi:hypothetical protein